MESPTSPEPTQRKPSNASSLGIIGLLGALLGSIVIGGIPTILDFVGEQHQRQQQEAERRAEMNRQLQKMQQDVQEGKIQAGPAFRSLMGEDVKD